MEEPTDPNFVEDMADVEARNYENLREKGTIFLWHSMIADQSLSFGRKLNLFTSKFRVLGPFLTTWLKGLALTVFL